MQSSQIGSILERVARSVFTPTVCPLCGRDNRDCAQGVSESRRHRQNRGEKETEEGAFSSKHTLRKWHRFNNLKRQFVIITVVRTVMHADQRKQGSVL